MYKAPSAQISKETLLLISKIEEKTGYWNCIKKFCDVQNEFPLNTTIKESIDSVSKVLKYDDAVDMMGYTMALNWVFADYHSIKLSKANIDKLYNMIENRPSDAKITKKEDKIIDKSEEESPFGSIFGGISLYEEEEPTKPEKADLKLDYALQDITEWAVKELKAKKQHPLIIISTFCAEFLRLKEYPSANSRISRVLTILLMLKSGYDFVLHFSLDGALEKEYGLYETAYESAINGEEFDIDFWNIVFIKILEKHCTRMSQSLERINIEPQKSNTEEECTLCALADDTQSEPIKKKDKEKDEYKELPVLQAKIMKMFSKEERITISGIVKSTKANLNTVKKHLASLVEKKLIEKHGKTRGAWYTQN